LPAVSATVNIMPKLTKNDCQNSGCAAEKLIYISMYLAKIYTQIIFAFSNPVQLIWTTRFVEGYD